MTVYLRTITKSETPQSEPLLNEAQVRNSAGGYVYECSLWDQLERFLILGSEGGTYYVDERALTLKNAKIVQQCLEVDAARTAFTIQEISSSGRAPKNSPAIFALALVAASPRVETRIGAYTLIGGHKVLRIPTHLFELMSYLKELRGSSSGLRKAIGRWYNYFSHEDLAYQLAKYQSRHGWSHKDVLRLVRPIPNTTLQSEIFGWAVGKELNEGIETASLSFLRAVDRAKTTNSIDILDGLIRIHKLPWECLPTWCLRDPRIWTTLVNENALPLTALLRNLGRMTNVGALRPLDALTEQVIVSLTSEPYIRKARIHPLQVLIAKKTYEQGHGEKGSLSWSPVQSISDALEDMFYLSFQNIKPSGKRIYLALDVSGSMTQACASSSLSCLEGEAALAMATLRSEPQVVLRGFSHTMVPIPIGKKTALSNAVKIMRQIPMGATDCALPIVDAYRNKLPVDAFVVYTDNETWSGPIHPMQALREYRKRTGIPAKLIVVGMTSTGFSIADPLDKGSLDVVGFDASVPQVISNFIKE